MNNLKKSKIFDHLGLKLVALIISFFIWLIVMNVDDYKITRTFTDIQVEQLNGDIIEQQGMVYDVVDGETASIIVKGPRSIVEKLTTSDFRAYADLSRLSVTNTAEIKVEALNAAVDSQISIEINTPTLTLSIEETASIELPIKIVTTGSVADNRALGTCVPTPNLVTVEGPASVLSTITELRAVVGLSGNSETFDEKVSIMAFDAYGKSLENKHIKLSNTEVTVNVPIYPTKTVPVELFTTGEPAEGYSIKSMSYTPQEVVIYGSEEALEGVQKIVIPDISVADATEGIEENMLISSYLPDDIFLYDSNQQIAVSITLEEHIQKKLPIKEENISIKGVNSNYTYKMIVPSPHLVTVSGLSDYIDGMKNTELGSYVDYSDYTPGEYDVPIQFTNSGDFDVIGDYSVRVIVTEKSTTEQSTDE